MGFRYVVRQSKPEDCGSILRLIKELAEFEGEDPDRAVQNTEEDLQDDCFGDHAYFRCLVTEAISDADHADKAERGTVVGYAMYFCAYSAWIGKLMYLEDLFVQPAHRDLRVDNFGDHAFFQCLVAEAIDDGDPTDKAQRGTVVGYAMYFCAYSSWIGRLMYLEDLFIQPAHQGQGLGKALVCKVAQIGSEKGCKGMQWVVQDSNNSARQFYNRLDAVDMTATDGWRVMGLRGENFSHVANSLTNLETNNIQWLC
ncbi:diamine acetyltransferase 2-like isoform X2 [Acanthaster planci]|uniref:Diamine acetyltransferase 2-like isoform X2 n=1 Tax=Acanthaster planci TaxID=133434 RepID=A0A8B7Z8N7_ACAPL|nr:diamine acetyltransferase 2-like isoform X2 [Acanthaster planci]